MKCVKIVELDEHELVSEKMNVVVSKILEATGVVKTKGLCDSDILSTMLRGRGSLGRHLREVCAENKDCSHIFGCTGTPSLSKRSLLTSCSNASVTMSNKGS